jgi:hypothetical protein
MVGGVVMDSVKNGLTSKPGPVSAGGPASVVSAPSISPDAQARHKAFLSFIHAKERAWVTLSPAEREAAEAGWGAVIKNINDARAGHRKVFVE